MTAKETLEPRGMSRREMLRGSLAAAVWSVPAVMAVRPVSASAGTPAPAPGTPAPDGVGAAGRPEGGLLPRTGGDVGWLLVGAAAATGTGSAALRRARTLRSRAAAADAEAGIAGDGAADVADQVETEGGSSPGASPENGPAGGREPDPPQGL